MVLARSLRSFSTGHHFTREMKLFYRTTLLSLNYAFIIIHPMSFFFFISHLILHCYSLSLSAILIFCSYVCWHVQSITMYCYFNNTCKKVGNDGTKKRKKRTEKRKASYVQKRQRFIAARWKYNGTHFTSALCPFLPPPRISHPPLPICVTGNFA